MSRPVDIILPRLNGVVPGKDNQEWQALCPAHSDENPSLSITVGNDDRVLLYCHAGCQFEDIVSALNLQQKDLFPNVSKGITLATLAEHKGLPGQFLNSIGVSDNPKKAGEVLIRYYLRDKNVAERHRIRTALRATEGIRWTPPQGGSIVPYGLWRLADAQTQGRLVIVEGESDCWTLWHYGIPALGIPGAQMTKVLQAEHLANVQKLYVVKEPDEGGNTFAQGMARRVREIGWQGKAFVISMPDGIKDPNDLHKADSSTFADKIYSLLDAAIPLPEPEGDSPKHRKGRSGEGSEQDNRTPVQILFDLANATCEFFHTGQNEAFALSLDGHRETWPVSSSGFKERLLMDYYNSQGGAPNQEHIQASLNLIAAKAKFEGPQHEVFTRIAEHGDSIYVDLCDPEWRAIKIHQGGWELVDNPPVRFRRASGMHPLPVPEKGGSIDTLRALLNISDQDTWVLTLGWMVQALRGKGPFPIFILQGEQGTAKSTTARLIRSLIDPAKPPYRTPPKDERDLLIQATHSWILSMDNLSGLSPWLSDALCRLATGGGFATRRLYSDSEEIIFDATRPVILNGIDEIGQRQDLLDRALIIRLAPIPDSARKAEADLVEEFEAARPKILGALFDGVSAALRHWKTVRLPEKPRMADFLIWASAAEAGLDLKPGSVQRAYNAFRFGAVRDSLDADPVAVALEEFMEGQDTWNGTATELLAELDQIAADKVKQSRAWPKLPNALSKQLNRLASFLRKAGIDVKRGTQGHQSTRIITITARLPGIVGTVGTGSSPADPPDYTVLTVEGTADDDADDTDSSSTDRQGGPESVCR